MSKHSSSSIVQFGGTKMEGTIRQKEAKSVVLDLLKQRHVPTSLFAIDGSKLRILIGARSVDIPLPRGLSFYGLQATLAKVAAAIDELEAARANRRQIDLEEAIAAAP